MSDSLNRKLVTYPHPRIHKEVKELANKQGVSVSKVVQNALDDYLKNINLKKGKK